jgi:BirA family biotin operon repressor/biotin-[acetyl-CoA-carboxylase] ligase
MTFGAAAAAAHTAAAARSRFVARDARWFPSVTSTMDVAERAVRAGVAEALVIVADEQTSGRGRRGRVWNSPPGAGLYISFVFGPPRATDDVGSASRITLAAGVAVRAAIQQSTGLVTELKWPNDVMVGRRKLAGILAEGFDVGTAWQTVILGIGINVRSASYAPDVAARATSLETELGRSVDRALVLEEVLVAVSDAHEDLRRGKADAILRQWREAAPSAEGARVEWTTNHRSHRGTTAGIDDDGVLLVRTSSGLERIVGGEVNWL